MLPKRLAPSCLLLSVLTSALVSGCHSSGRAEQPAPPAFVQVVCLNERCGVIDQDLKQRVPFERGYQTLLLAPNGQSAFAYDGKSWLLLDLVNQSSKQPLEQPLSDQDDIKALDTPDLVAFQRGDKWGVMDFSGNQQQPARFDDIDSSRLGDSAIRYTVGDKSGLLDASGVLLTEPLYDEDIWALTDDTGSSVGLALAQRGEQSWLIHFKNGTQETVPYSYAYMPSDQHAVVAAGDHESYRTGLIDTNGKVVIDLKYKVLGNPSAGLVSFSQTSNGPCGYLNYQGDVVISARFLSCGPFGKSGAFAEDSTTGKWGFIDRSGGWRLLPSYDFAGGPVTYSTASRVNNDTMQNVTFNSRHELFPLRRLDSLRTVAQFHNGAAASQMQRQALYRFMAGGDSYIGVVGNDPNNVVVTDVRSGIFDADRGSEVVNPTHLAISALTPNRFVFADQVDTSDTITSGILPGVMDANGKVVIAPGHFNGFRMDATGHYLLAERSDDELLSLYDQDGHLLIASPYKALLVDTHHGVVFGYDRYTTPRLGGIYDLHGHSILSIKTTACGAQQLLDGAGKPVWPLDPTPYCQD